MFIYYQIVTELGYTLLEVVHLFKQLVLPKFTYALPVHGASQSDLNMIQFFLTGCYKDDIL